MGLIKKLLMVLLGAPVTPTVVRTPQGGRFQVQVSRNPNGDEYITIEPRR